MKHEEQLARQICRVLDEGARTLEPSIAERLRAARENALLQKAAVARPVAIVGAGGTVALGGGDGRHPVRTLFAIIALLLGFSIAYYWNGLDQASANEEIDSALLADELPPDAYLDRGFHAWLEKRSVAD